MKSFKSILTIVLIAFVFSSCSFFQGIFGGGGNKNGCPSNGKNVGAERLMSDDSRAKGKNKVKVPKASKYKLGKF